MPASYEQRRTQRKKPRRLLSLIAGGFLSQRVKGTLRVGAYLFVMCCVLAVVSARSAWGSVSEQALVAGRQIAKLEDFTGAPERLSLNGQALQISSALSDLTLDQVLDRFEGVCKEDGAIARDFKEIKGLLGDAALVEKAKAGNWGVLREQTKDDGVVACAVRNPANGARSTAENMAKFAESWDVADVGLLRLVYARKTQSGRTHVLTVWTDGAFKLDAMMPPESGGDAPGSDPAGAPRPDSSVRYLTAAAEGRPHAVRIYESRASADQVLGSYERELPKLGWEPIHVGEDAAGTRYFSREGVDLMVVADQTGDRSVVSLLETRGQ